jgi:hypothetical protein
VGLNVITPSTETQAIGRTNQIDQKLSPKTCGELFDQIRQSLRVALSDIRKTRVGTQLSTKTFHEFGKVLFF